MKQWPSDRTIFKAGAFSLVVGVLVMVGWIFNIIYLQSVIPGYISMKFNTALCFAFLGLALIITQKAEKWKWLFILLCAFVALIGFVTIAEYQLRIKTGLDQFFFTDSRAAAEHFNFPGRMAENTAFCFVLLGVGMLGLLGNENKFSRAFQYLFHIVTIISCTAVIGYVYGVALLYKLSYTSSMAIHTAALFLILSIVIAKLNPHLGIAKLFTGKGIGNKMALQYFVAFVIAITVFGFLRVQSQRNHYLTTELGVSILAIALMLTSLAIVWKMANWLNRLDNQRNKAEEEVKYLINDLEITVIERTKQLHETVLDLQKSEENYRSLIEQASDAIYVLDPRGNFIDVNQSVCKMMGYTRKEFLTMNITDLFNEEMLKIHPLIYNDIKIEQSIIGDRKYMRRDSSFVDIEFNVKKLNDGRIFVIARDISERKKLESRLKNAELRFRTLADKSSVGIYIVQNGVFSYVNPRFAEIFGYAATELIGARPVEAIIHPDYRARAQDNIQFRLKGDIESVNYEAIGIKKDGSSNWVEFYGSRVFFDEEPVIIGSMIDITERKNAEDEVRLSEQKYKLLFNASPVPMLMIDKANLHIIAVNAAAIRLYGYTESEFLEKTILDIRLPDEKEEVIASYKLNIDVSSDMGIVRHICKDGTIIYVQVNAHDFEFEGTTVRLALKTDVTDKLKIKEAQQKSEANLKTIINNTDTAYALFDSDMNILEYNNKVSLLLQTDLDTAAISRQEVLDSLPQLKRDGFLENAADVLKGNIISYEINYPGPNDELFWSSIRMFPVSNAAQQVIGIVLTITDITERKQAEENLHLAYQSIELHLNKIREMAWKQSHVIRSPLANIMGLISMIRLDPTDERSLDYIETELQRMDSVLWEMADAVEENKHVDADNSNHK